jgi:hypothetical protein
MTVAAVPAALVLTRSMAIAAGAGARSTRGGRKASSGSRKPRSPMCERHQVRTDKLPGGGQAYITPSRSLQRNLHGACHGSAAPQFPSF